MSRLGTIWLVAGRELKERMRSRATRVVTLLMPVLVFLLIAIPALVHAPASATTLGLVGRPAQALRADIQAAAKATGVEMRLRNVASSSSAKRQLGQGRIDVALALRGSSAVVTVPGSVGYFETQTLAPRIQAILQATVNVWHEQRVLLGAGVPIPVLRSALTPVPLSVKTLKPPPKDMVARDVAALAAAFLLYMTLALYGNAVVAGVAQEKTSRMAEVLVAAVRATDLLIGKVLGIGLFAFGQMLLTVAAAFVANAVFQNTAIPGTVWTLLPSILLWFLLGYVLYAFAYAVGGALVGRQEDVQTIAAPFMVPLIAGFMLTYLAIAEPTNAAVRILSFLPPLAPILMPARLALGPVAPWQVALAVLLTLLAIWGEVRLAARVYALALVHSGPRLTWRAALRLHRG